MNSPWPALEEMPGLAAVPAGWRIHMGEHFEPFTILCFDLWPTTVKTIPCAICRGCAFLTTTHVDGQITGVCTAHRPVCPPATFTLADITPLEVNWPRL